MTAKSGVSVEWTKTNTGDVTAVSGLGDVALTMVVGNVGIGTSIGDMTAISDVADVAGTTGVGEEEQGRAMVT